MNNINSPTLKNIKVRITGSGYDYSFSGTVLDRGHEMVIDIPNHQE